MRLVLDTNSLLRSLPYLSPHHDLWLSFFDGRNYLCLTNEIINEYEEILKQRLPLTLASDIIKQIITNPYTIYVTRYFKFNLISSDEDDNKFVDCAVASDANYIVTEDRHFNVLNQIGFPKVNIINLNTIIKLI